MTIVVIGDNTGDDFSGTIDSNLYEDTPTTVQTNGLDIGKFDPGRWRYGVLAFTGISNLPSSITVSSAVVSAYLANANGLDHVFTSYRLLQNWVEAEATWNAYSTGNNWSTAGGLGATDRSSTASATSETIAVNTGLYYELLQNTVQLRTDIENFASGTFSNYGWHIERTDDLNDSEFRLFAQHEGTDGQRPYLTVDYTAGGTPSITPNKLTQTQSVDASALTQQHNIAPTDLAQAHSLDADVITQLNNITPVDLTQAHTLDADVLTQQNIVAPVDLTQAHTLDADVITQLNNITPADLTQAHSIDLASLVTAGTLSPQDLLQAQSVDASALTQHHSIAVNDLLQSMGLDASAVVQHHVINPAAIDQAQSLATTTISSFAGVTPDELNQSQGMGVVVITQHHVINPDALDQAHNLDATTIDNGLTPDIIQIIGTEVTIIRSLTASQAVNRTLTQTGKLS